MSLDIMKRSAWIESKFYMHLVHPSLNAAQTDTGACRYSESFPYVVPSQKSSSRFLMPCRSWAPDLLCKDQVPSAAWIRFGYNKLAMSPSLLFT
jgi:hypothetical protein